MMVVHDLEECRFENVVLTIGNFDGVHRGHRAILDAGFQRAEDANTQLVAVTFDPHPSVILTPDRVPPILTPLDEKLFHMRKAGVDATVVVRTTPEFLSISAEAFITDVILAKFKPVAMVEGPTFGFGHHRQGDVNTLRAAGKKYGFDVQVVEPVRVALGGHPDTVISSSLIRHLLGSGTVDGAALCLGRPYALFGQVRHGAGRGKPLGFPTANLAVGPQLIPAEGVYAGQACLILSHQVPGHPGLLAASATEIREPIPAAISIGRNPTFNETELSVEAFLLDFEGDVYEQPLNLEFLEWLRPQQKFASPAALVEQIQLDVQQTRQIVDSRKPQ